MKMHFDCSCRNGHINIAQWLYELSIKNNQPINIHVNNEEAFRLSCTNGHINVAQWLYELSIQNNQPIDIHAVMNMHFVGVVEMVILILHNGYMN